MRRLMNLFGIFQICCHYITQMWETFIRSVFTVIDGLTYCSWKQRLNASRIRYKMGFCHNHCHIMMKNENWEERFSL